MGKKIKYIIIFIVAVAITATAIILLLNYINKEQNSISEVSTQTQPEQNITQTDNTLVIGIEKNEEEQEEVEEPKEETAKTPAQLTQEIYNINGPIGTLVIPKTGLNTQIYSSVIVEQMEKMPCFLYTTGGLNKTGTTLFVGHNRRNGTLFSENDKLSEGDEFYFTDYEGTEKKYTIYSKFITTDTDISFLNQQVDAPTIALSCCTDANDEHRIIILGRADP